MNSLYASQKHSEACFFKHWPIYWWVMRKKSCGKGKGPRTIQLKLQKSRYHPYTLQLFFHKCNDFFNSFIYGQRFSHRFFGKIIVRIVVVCEGLKQKKASAAPHKTKSVPAMTTRHGKKIKTCHCGYWERLTKPWFYGLWWLHSVFYF